MRELWKGLRVKLWRLGDAGGYSLIRVDNLSDDLVKIMSGGQPFTNAYQEAEELAVLIDAEFTLNGEIIRRSTKGEYYDKEPK